MNKPWQETTYWKNESQYLTWLRGQFRKIWMDFIPKNEFISEKCFPVTEEVRQQQNLHRLTKTAGECVFCHQIFGRSKLQVDHKIPAGSMLVYSEAPAYLLRLLCSKDNMQLSCKPCHDIKTYADKHKLSYDDAGKEKQAIAFSKWPVDRQIGYIVDVLGFSKLKIKNKAMRRQVYRKSLD